MTANKYLKKLDRKHQIFKHGCLLNQSEQISINHQPNEQPAKWFPKAAWLSKQPMEIQFF
jgi:hypothetical protein